MGTDAAFFARPEGDAHPLGIPPRLAAWMATGHPDQVHVRAFVTHAARVLGPPRGGPAALRLDVGLPDDVRLHDQYGLSHYVCRLVEWLGSSAGWDLASVWATKAAGPDTTVRADTPRPVDPPAGDRRFVVRTDTAAGSPAFTVQVRGQLADEDPVPPGPLAVHLSFAVPPGCNWAGLWQPTVDGLAPVLGSAADDRAGDPCDGRIVELALHRRDDASLARGVVVTGVVRRLPG